MIRRLIDLTALLLIGVLVFAWLRASDAAARPQAPASFDWSAVSTRDLDIASVFLAAKSEGVGRAMDSLSAFVKRDSTLEGDGHMIAHALGRFAIANNGHDPAVLRECRPTFEAGCYHGVLEGLLAAQQHVDPPAMAKVCTSFAHAGDARELTMECAHGLGHGFTEAMGYDLARALGACDSFDSGDLRGECHDGVFMENAVHGVGMKGMNVGDAALAGAAHEHMAMDMGSPAPSTNSFRKSDVAFPCDSVAAQYQPSCWSYQPLVIARLRDYDLERTLKDCSLAPSASASNCYRGFGKQSQAFFRWNRPKVIGTCTGAGAFQTDCFAGAVEALVDRELSARGAIDFCGAVPEGGRKKCFESVGVRIAPLHADDKSAARECAMAGLPEYVDACIRGTR
ncbi:MAG TPA: hypothetical protein VGQ44_22400 [Gemmatimonadaceae bacterium]|jgi:hypothetical protein|nr:hypothetical protein [Gemmatimonadaceae bacterium]